jgi:hypothetical protein
MDWIMLGVVLTPVILFAWLIVGSQKETKFWRIVGHIMVASALINALLLML